MKKLFALLLCFSLLLLPGCRLQDLFQLETIVPPTGSPEDYVNWNDFLWNCKKKVTGSVTLTRPGENGTGNEATVTYDGEKYSITDAAGTRTYTYLFGFNHTEKTEAGYRYGDYFFLTDDPKMTFEKYQKAQSSFLKDHMELLLPTELVLGKTAVADAVECYGLAPAKIDKILSAHLDGNGHAQQYCRNSFFVTSTSGYPSLRKYYNEETLPTDGNYSLDRYDYNGDLLCSVEIPMQCYANKIAEFEDGSFMLTLDDYSDEGEVELLYYSDSGKLQWHYVYPADRDLTLAYFFLVDDIFYVFGGLNTDSYYEMNDLYIAKFSKDGTLLKEILAGGSESDVLKHVELSENGFTLFARTKSSDGDFPVGTKEDDTLFHVEVSTELEFSELTCPIKKTFTPNPVGFYKGEIIYKDDPMLQIKDSDRLPENTNIYSLKGFIPWGNGYVILRSHCIGEYSFSSPYLSAPGAYWQIIATCYNAKGEPVWQTVSQPYVS